MEVGVILQCCGSPLFSKADCIIQWQEWAGSCDSASDVEGSMPVFIHDFNNKDTCADCMGTSDPAFPIKPTMSQVVRYDFGYCHQNPVTMSNQYYYNNLTWFQ